MNRAPIVLQHLDWMSDAVVCLDRDWRYTYVNRRAGELFGRDPEALIGKHIWTEFPEAVGQEFQRTYEQAVADGRARQFEAYYPPWDRWFENRVYPTPEGLAIFFSDVTERVRAEQQARRDAAAREQAERMAHVGFWQLRLGDGQVTWSDELARIFGIADGERLRGLDEMLARVHPDDRGSARAMIEDAIGRRGTARAELRIVRPDGRVRHLQTWSAVAVDARGEPSEVFGTVLDVSERVAMVAGLNESERRLDLAIEAAGIGVWDWDVRTDEVTWSRGLETVFGRPLDGVRTLQDFYRLIHEDDRARIWLGVHASIQPGGPSHEGFEYRLRLPDGTIRWVSLWGRVLRDEAGRAERVLGSIVDITDRRRAAEAQQRAQTMETVGRIARGLVHGLSNLLTVINTSVTLIERGDAEGRARSISDIREASARGGELIRQLAALVRHDAEAEVEVELDAALEDLRPGLARAASERIEVHPALGAGDARVRIDPSALERLMAALVARARDVIVGPGALTITTRAEPDRVVVEVHDTGPDLSPAALARAFEPSIAPGTGGGGLAIAYGLVRQAAGSIELSSEPGAGTTVRFALPRASR